MSAADTIGWPQIEQIHGGPCLTIRSRLRRCSLDCVTRVEGERCCCFLCSAHQLPSVKPSEPEPSRRPYHSPKRAAAALKTRQAIRAAAEALFLRDGYTQTTMRAIAQQAGVPEKTMYLAYATKANLLREVIQVAVRGDEDPRRCPSDPNGAP
jgi:hypothetical protein